MDDRNKIKVNIHIGRYCVSIIDIVLILITKQNANSNYNINGDKTTSDGTSSGQHNLNLNNTKEFPRLPVNMYHSQNNKDNPNKNKNIITIQKCLILNPLTI